MLRPLAAAHADTPPPQRRTAAAASFYDGTVKIGMMEAFKKLAVGPDALPDIIFASIGRTIWKVRGTLCISACVQIAR